MTGGRSVRCAAIVVTFLLSSAWAGCSRSRVGQQCDDDDDCAIGLLCAGNCPGYLTCSSAQGLCPRARGTCFEKDTILQAPALVTCAGEKGTRFYFIRGQRYSMDGDVLK